jgi:hypothetical protein
MGRGFLLVAGVVVGVSLVDRLFDLDLFRGSPLGTGLFLGVIGGLLLQTVAQVERGERLQRDDAEGDGSAHGPT